MAPPSQLGRKRSDHTKALLRAAAMRRSPNSWRSRPYESLFNHCRYLASLKQIPFSLSFEDFVKLTEIKQCHYCKEAIFWTARNLPKNGSGYNLDRKVNAIGYTFENVVVCCKTCNRVKGGTFTYGEFVHMMNALLAYRESIRIV